MRIATDETDPGYANWMGAGGFMPWRILIDGREVQDDCDLADEEEGFVRVAKKGSDGEFYCEPGTDDVAVEILRGKVVIIPSRPAA